MHFPDIAHETFVEIGAGNQAANHIQNFRVESSKQNFSDIQNIQTFPVKMMVSNRKIILQKSGMLSTVTEELSCGTL